MTYIQWKVKPKMERGDSHYRSRPYGGGCLRFGFEAFDNFIDGKLVDLAVQVLAEDGVAMGTGLDADDLPTFASEVGEGTSEVLCAQAEQTGMDSELLLLSICEGLLTVLSETAFEFHPERFRGEAAIPEFDTDAEFASEFIEGLLDFPSYPTAFGSGKLFDLLESWHAVLHC
jgi:hypothetical protein